MGGAASRCLSRPFVLLGGAASQGKKAAAEQRDAGLKPQGQAARMEDSASLPPSLVPPSASVSQFPLVSGLGDKPAIPQELASAGVFARNLPPPLQICDVGRVSQTDTRTSGRAPTCPLASRGHATLPSALLLVTLFPCCDQHQG